MRKIGLKTTEKSQNADSSKEIKEKLDIMWQIEIHWEVGGRYVIGYTGQSKITLELGLKSYLS